MTRTYGGRRNGPYTVLDPVRTPNGKLRLEGPFGGYMTAWWYYEDMSGPFYTLEVNPVG